MQNDKIRSIGAKHWLVSHKRSILAAGGLAMALSTAVPASAVVDERFFLRAREWGNIGINGSTAVAGNLDGGAANVNHIAFSVNTPISIAYPPLLATEPNRLDFVTSHATAAIGAIGASNSSSALGTSPLGSGIVGFAPGAKLLAGNIASGIRVQDGTFSGLSNEGFFFPLLAMTDQDFANDVQPFLVDRLGNPLPPYRVATVVNISFGTTGSSQRQGEDATSDMLNMIVTRTDATIVAAAGNFGDDPELENLDPEEGSIASPGGAHNAIAVGFTETGSRGALREESSGELGAATDWRVDAQLLTIEALEDPDANAPTQSPVFPAIRSTVDISAPGTDLELPGNFGLDPLSDTSFLRGWDGTSFASGIVAGALTLMHDLHRVMYFQENEFADEFDQEAVLPQVVTRAIMMASANRETGWSNGAIPNDQDVSSTETPLDPRLGAGRLDMKQLLRTYMGTPDLGGYRDIKPGDGLVQGFRRNPAITDPDSSDLTSFAFYPVRDPGTGQAVLFEGTDPEIGLITVFSDPNAGQLSFGGRSQESAPVSFNSDSIDSTISVPRDPGPTDMGAMKVYPQILETPNNDGNGLDMPSSGGSTGGLGSNGDGGLTEGTSSGSGAGGGGGGSSGGAGTSWGDPDAYKSGWDHGMLGQGSLDIPIGVVTAESDISVAIVWKRIMVLDEQIIDEFVDLIQGTRTDLRTAAMELERLERNGQLDELQSGSRSRRDVSDQPDIIGARPMIMAGATHDPEDPLTIVNSFDSDESGFRIDPNTLDSPYAGVCHIRAKFQGGTIVREGTGVVFETGIVGGNRFIMTAAHLTDFNNDGRPDGKDFTITFNGIGADDVSKQYSPAFVSKVHIHPEFLGMGVPNGNVHDDFAIIEMRPEVDFAADGIPAYTRQTSQTILPEFGVGSPTAIPLLMVGYGKSGSGETGEDASSKIVNSVRRVGWNELNDLNGLGIRYGTDDGGADDDTQAEVFIYDFDAPPGTAIVSDNFDGRPSLGNRLYDFWDDDGGVPSGGVREPDSIPDTRDGITELDSFASPPTTIIGSGESIIAEGDSGGPAFLWFDTGDDIVQLPELRILGINTFIAPGDADEANGQFGNWAGGAIISAYNDFIDDIVAPVVPPLPPPGPFIQFDGELGLPADMVNFKYEDINLALYRRNFDGSGFVLVSESVSLADNFEFIYATDDDQIAFGDYFVRVSYELEVWDFGGSRFFGYQNVKQNNGRGNPYVNNFDADIPFGIAWYIDLTPDRDLDASFRSTRSGGLHDPNRFMGDMNHDTRIDGEDLAALLTRWGSVGDPGRTRGDLNHDGQVSADDLGVMLMNWTGPRPE